MPAIVSDSSVLISLGGVGLLDLLREFHQTILIPPSVWVEVAGAADSPPAASVVREAQQVGWIKVEPPRNAPLVRSLAATLDQGEAEAIALAVELPAALLLIDESDGRRAARDLGISLTGTIGILLRAKVEGRLVAVRPVLDDLITRQHFRLGRSLYLQVLKEAGEGP
jgi:predicted nucleic acid-binding protein